MRNDSTSNSPFRLPVGPDLEEVAFLFSDFSQKETFNDHFDKWKARKRDTNVFLVIQGRTQIVFSDFLSEAKSNNKWLFYFLKDSEIDYGSQSIRIKQSNIYINEYI